MKKINHGPGILLHPQSTAEFLAADLLSKWSDTSWLPFGVHGIFCGPLYCLLTNTVHSVCHYWSHKVRATQNQIKSSKRGMCLETKFKRTIIIIPSFSSISFSSQFSVSLNSQSREYCMSLAGIEDTQDFALGQSKQKRTPPATPRSSKRSHFLSRIIQGY